MQVWITQDGEPLPGIDAGTRAWRSGILAQSLVAQGHQVLWWASDFSHFTKHNRFSETRTIETMPNLRVRLLPGLGYVRNSSPKRILHHRMVANAFASEAKTLPRPDIIFTSLPTPELAEQAVLYGQRTQTPVIVDVRDLWPDHYLTRVPKALRRSFKLLLFGEFARVRRLLQGATGITSISQSFLNWGLQNAKRTKNAMDDVFPMGYPALSLSHSQLQDKQQDIIARYDLKLDNLIIVFVGSFNSIFDFHTVIEAIRILEQKQQIKVQFVMVGNNHDSKELHAQALGLRQIIFTGWFDQVSIAALLSLASVGITPYSEGPSITGSLPNKLFEYMSSGLPILSSHQGDLETLIRDEQIGLHYQAGNVQSLVEKTIWLAEHPSERAEMGHRSQQLFNKRFRADIVYPQMVAHLENIANQGNHTN